MKRGICVLLGIGFLTCCRGKEPQVDKVVEGGVEVVLNHVEPYKLKAEPSQLLLEEKISIDLGSKDFEQFGFKEPAFAEADSEGNIYVAEEYGPVDYFIYKFDKNGTLVHETPVPSGFPGVTPLENGKYVVLRRSVNKYELAVLDSNHKMETLDSYDLSEFGQGKKTTAIVPLFYWRVTSERIYIGNEQRGYEILVFNLDGKLLRKIRKEFSPVIYLEEFKAQTREMIERDPRYAILKKMPPFNSFLIDDAHRLYVMTYEKGEEGDEYLHDIYNSDGVLIGRKFMKLHGVLGRGLNHRWAVAKNGRYYCLKYDQESGYPKLIVYQMIWK